MAPKNDSRSGKLYFHVGVSWIFDGYASVGLGIGHFAIARFSYCIWFAFISVERHHSREPFRPVLRGLDSPVGLPAAPVFGSSFAVSIVFLLHGD